MPVGQGDPFKKCLEVVQVSTIAFVLSSEFNLIAERKNIQKVKFLDIDLLRSDTVDLCAKYYTIEQKLEGAGYKRFNSNTGVITAFAHYTCELTKGYLVVYDLQGIELNNQFILTDPAIHCVDSLRFGTTNFGKKGIKKVFQCFLENHKCNDICKKLELNHIN